MLRLRRWAMHGVFGAAALLFAAASGWQGWRLQHALQVNEAIAAADLRVPGVAASGAAASGAAASGAAASQAEAAQIDAPPAMLAHALALARNGQHDAAFKAYSALILRHPESASGRAAVYDLGNMYLRQGIAAGASVATAATALPLLELAKKRYRDLLRLAPGDWDARYNLERALRLAPEQDVVAEVEGEPVKRRPISQGGMKAEDLP
jgi:mxaK protein